MIISRSKEWDRLQDDIKGVIRKFQVDGRPVDLAGLAKDLGVPVKGASLPPGVSGEIRPDGRGGYVIRVNRHDSKERQRFTVAHELAHFLLHKDLIGSGIRDDALYRSNQSSSIEAQANRLASDIVMPSEQITSAMADLRGANMSEVKQVLAERFGVSGAAMSIKLGDG